jgi:hypothetical protein
MKQKQHHGHRAPRGNPEHTVRISFRCTPAMKRLFDRKGGSEWARQTLQRARFTFLKQG